MALVDDELARPRDRGRDRRADVDRADRRPAALVARRLADGEDEPGARHERVAARVHRKAAALHGLAADADAVALDPGGAGDDPDRQPFALEDRALLDVELEVGDGSVEPRPGARRGVEVDPVGGERVDERDAVAVLDVADAAGLEGAGGEARAEQRAPEARALLVGPVDERDGHGRLAGGRERAQDLEPAEDAQRAVEPAAVGDRVHVAAEDHRPLARPGEDGPEVARLVDVDVTGSSARRSRSQARAAAHVSVHATRWAPRSSSVSSRSARRSASARLRIRSAAAMRRQHNPLGQEFARAARTHGVVRVRRVPGVSTSTDRRGMHHAEDSTVKTSADEPRPKRARRVVKPSARSGAAAPAPVTHEQIALRAYELHLLGEGATRWRTG